MPVFTLTKYAAEPTPQDPVKDPESTDNEVKEEDVVRISASDPVSKLVAKALHKRLCVKEGQEDQEATPQTAVVSTEEINQDPVGVYNRTKNASKVVILNSGFKTTKDEWILMSLESQGKKVFYSI